jgi:hypothetical protein
MSYRRELEFSKEFREAFDEMNIAKLRAIGEKYPDLFPKRLERLRRLKQDSKNPGPGSS